MKGEDTTERVRMRSQKRNSKWMGMMKWNKKRGLEWNWIRVSVIIVVDRKHGMEIDENEWIENIDANRNEKQRYVVMRVMELK